MNRIIDMFHPGCDYSSEQIAFKFETQCPRELSQQPLSKDIDHASNSGLQSRYPSVLFMFSYNDVPKK